MNRKKTKTKARRRAKKLQNQAWEAEAEGHLHLALKAMRRALEDGQDNPTIWNDYGMILQRSGSADEAEKAYRNAILIAPDYAEAYANLASLVSQLGRSIQAERLQREAVRLAPEDSTFTARLKVYQTLLPEVSELVETQHREPEDSAAAEKVLCLDRFDWDRITQDLTESGCALLRELLTPEQCEQLTTLYEEDKAFEKTVHLDDTAGQSGAYRFFRRPLPELVQSLRAGLYARLAPVADSWNALLGNEQRWPAHHREFLAQCAEAGQDRTTPILLRYRAPAVNELHQDVWGRIYFPLQLAVTLSPRGDEGFTGGSFVLADDGTGRKARRLEIPTSRGDAVVFCTRERLVKVADRYAYQPVRHGMATLLTGERYVLGIPFHDYKG